ncbi:MAG: hypothetical protein COX92_00510 [Candidatus Nealsonbacteria bacterium CG_4_10_14_0_2_um_filter_40_15]|uniref:DUF6938 domain-containing protein n=1 Tax=Candidatus Nealsonbacteria bacterium CG_4_10_14_0_2_um_filter_40_15 TaxID=1974682 RepID=A0A2M7UV79_9BACT|nr:MAG: hypothetical protein COX92_00510 [Candidatus Nealsonbacteria bacterium CG_4_10_14_0_2_um_filter_40_15]
MNQKAWIISVNMGYGHQRTAFPLRDLAPEGKVICANDYLGMPVRDRRIWETTRKIYESISRIKKIPLIGEFIFFIFDRIQKILRFYPKRDMSQPNFQLKQISALIKRGWGKHLIEKLKSNPLPIITTFFTPAFMAEYFGYPGEIFCVICDADIARTWAPICPQKSRIKYFAPTSWVVSRLKLYGVKEENIFFTGYPLPQSLIGGEKMETLLRDLESRIFNLDQKKKYFKQYKVLVDKYFGRLPEFQDHPLTIMFAVGGAGAQKEIGIKILKSLAGKIKADEIKIILVAGTRKEVKEYFERNIKNLKLKNNLDKNIEIVFDEDIESYFQKFNLALRKTDVLWTKPSEISFYTALGFPIIIAPPVGSQEEFNKKWLLRLGSGIPQENPNYTNQWLFDFLDSGRFAEAAMQGFIEGEKLGIFNIQKIISQ